MHSDGVAETVAIEVQRLKLTVSDAMPRRPVFRQRAIAPYLVDRQSQAEDIRRRQVGVVVAHYLFRYVSEILSVFFISNFQVLIIIYRKNN